jgi:hypothetical protein
MDSHFPALLYPGYEQSFAPCSLSVLLKWEDGYGRQEVKLFEQNEATITRHIIMSLTSFMHVYVSLK